MDNVTFNLLIDKVRTVNYNRSNNPWESKCINKKNIDISTLREKYTLSTEALADILGVETAEVEKWEESGNTPKGAASHLLRIAERYPAIFLETLWNY